MLLGLLVLPLLWWLLRAVPPAPRPQSFPAIRLLAGLQATRQEALRAPPWLLLLRLLAGTLLVLGLAQPVLVQEGSVAPASRAMLIVLDDGWAASNDWPLRVAALDALLDHASRANQLVRLLATADDESGAIRPPGAPIRPDQLRAAIDARRPRSWNTDRAAAARALEQPARSPAGGPVGSIVYFSDGLATPGDAALAAALHRLGPVSEWRADPQRLRLLLPPVSMADGLTARVGALPQAVARPFTVHAEDAEGGTLARVDGSIPARAQQGQAPIILPVELRNRIARLVLDGTPGPAGLRLLDESDRRRPVGLIASGSFTDAPLLGPLFYLRRALALDTELRTGDAASLLSRQLSVLIAPDGTLADAQVRHRVADWVRGGGMLIRFAGPQLAAGEQADPSAAPDAAASSGEVSRQVPDPAADPAGDPVAQTLLPAPLLDGARTLGGAMSWSRPAHLAAFGADTPFAGLDVPADVTVSRQVLARPATDLDARSWSHLSDGTPLVTHAALGAGQVVLFHVTSTPDWSTLPFSGLFVQMLHRLVQRSAGLSAQGGNAVLAPVSTLDGDGVAGAPPPSARGLAAQQFGRVSASALHPPGFYGPSSDRRALNTGDALPPLAASAPFGAASDLAGRLPDRPLGPLLLAAALVLLAIELVATLWLRGLLQLPTRSRAARPAALLLLAGVAIAGGAAAGAEDVPPAALQTRLGYVVTGDAQTDGISREGLEGLSNYVNARTSAVLGHPDAVHPGQDDLAFYPLLYWPITQGAAADPGAISALNAYMNRGGILLIDTKGSDTGGGSFTGLAASSPQALRQATSGLDIPPLAPVDSSNVLSHSFYLLHAFPGRYVGAPVWVAATGEPGRDNVSPLIIGANDWASAWATDAAGDTPYAVIPGGERQRTLAYRFGVNAVIYALTGNYKSDQVHVPALLQRLGE